MDYENASVQSDSEINTIEEENKSTQSVETGVSKENVEDTSTTNTKKIKDKSNKKHKEKKTLLKKENKKINDNQTENEELSEEQIINTKVKIVTRLLDGSFIFVFLISMLLLLFTYYSYANGGIPSFGKYSMLNNSSPITNEIQFHNGNVDGLVDANYVQFKRTNEYNVGDLVAFREANIPDPSRKFNYSQSFNVAKVIEVVNDTIVIKTSTGTTNIPNNLIIGSYVRPLKMSNFYGLFTDFKIFIIFCLFPLFFLMLIGSVCYFALFPAKMPLKKLSQKIEKVADASAEKKIEEEKIVAKEAEPEANLNSSINIINVANKDTFEIYTNDNGESQIQNTNYYTNVVLSGNDLYAKIKKFNESIALLNETGANDMDIIRINMIGNEDFDKLLTTTRKNSESLSLDEIIQFINTLPDIHCIKKVGKINWTYKYKSKTFAILREDGSDKEGYKLSFKVYPDAAQKLNVVFMALEDSNFPSGPYWYMINNLKNVPMNIIKWLLQESYRISKLQQLKSDYLRTDKPLDKLIDVEPMRTAIQLSCEVNNYNKCALVIKDVSQQNPRYTVLEDKIKGLDMSKYNKELYFPIANDRAISVLLNKNTTELIANAFSYDFLDVIKPKEEQQIVRQPSVDLNRNTRTTSTTVVKKKRR